MSIELRQITESTFAPYAGQLMDTFGGDASSAEQIQLHRRETELPRAIGAYDGDLLVGTAGSLGWSVTVPGGETVPLAAVSDVSVRSTHRRRGILRQMMAHQLQCFHERGEALAALWASEAAIYGRFGYGPGVPSARLRIERSESAFRRPLDAGRIREIDSEAALEVLPPIAAAAARKHPGFVLRSRERWAAELADPAAGRRGGSRLFLAVHDGPDGPDGYAAYRTHHAWSEAGRRTSKLEVLDLIAITAPAYAALWRFCLDVDLIVTVEGRHRSVDEPLRHLLIDPRALQVSVTDGLWLRLVDVAAALRLRRYPVAGGLALEVHDRFCGWNQGRLLLEAGPDGASVGPTTREADLALDAAALGAIYLGGQRPSTLAAAGLIDELRPGTLARA
ncbi:MAG: GNAT family N-acetyltransferase, partial [Candidatus Dormiibacterota bacterium]